MVKRTIKETITEYNDKGGIIRQTITETTEDDDTVYTPYYPTTTGPYVAPGTTPYDPFLYQPTCTSGTAKGQTNSTR